MRDTEPPKCERCGHEMVIWAEDSDDSTLWICPASPLCVETKTTRRTKETP